MRRVLDDVLHAIDEDGLSGPLLRATGIRERLEVTDLGLVLNVAASDDPDHHLRWRFSDRVDWEPKLRLAMSSEVANRYLQGRENVAIGIVRGRIRASGDSRAALVYLPVAKLIVDRYRSVVRDRYPHLEV
jgi:hypothetical protein